MRRQFFLSAFFLITTVLISRTLSFGQSDPIERGLWYNTEKTAKIQIYKAADGKFSGKIVWLKVPDRDGHPKVDIHNPDEKRRNDPFMGLVILKGFTKDGDHEYGGGTIYDPSSGKTYSSKMTLDGNNLDVRGYMGFSMFGRTEHWTKAE
jgi:uncharacterized protein (DUF2147 family)